MALTEKQLRALEALESMDDFARMDTGVEPIGPYRVLREFIEASIAAPASEQKPKQPWPNHNWCVGCSPDNCSGCGTEPLERRAAQPDYKAQRDAERYRFLRDSQEGKTIRIKPRLLWNEEIDAASASVKGEAK